MQSTTGNPIGMPPTLTGYAFQVDYSFNLTDGFNPAPQPQYFHMYYTLTPPTLFMGIVAYSLDGWLGFGWSPSGIMQTPNMPSDAVLAYVDTIGNTFVSDFTLIGRSAPTPTSCAGPTPGVCPDISIAGCADNIVVKSISRQSNYLILQFSRPMTASDKCDVAIVPGGANQNAIFALGPTITSMPWPYSVQFHTYHTNGTTPINWMVTGGTTASTTKPNGVDQLRISIFAVLFSLLLFLM